LVRSPWAEFSRHADLSTGPIVYPLEAFGGVVLMLSAAIHLDRRAQRAAAVPLYAAALLVAGGLLFTLKAASILLSLRDREGNRFALQAVFERGICAICLACARRSLSQLAALALLWPGEWRMRR
jgi:hypothetical protein